MAMLVKILLAGTGGQGVLTAGNILANAAMLEDYHVVYLPSYGAAMRGGTANCTVSISDEEIASPVASAPDYILAMNQPSAHAFIARLGTGGQMLYNADLVETVPYRGDIDVFPIPANTIARELGSERSANMVLLGSFLKLTGVVKIETLVQSIEYMMSGKKKLVDLAVSAVMAGYERLSVESHERQQNL